MGTPTAWRRGWIGAATLLIALAAPLAAQQHPAPSGAAMHADAPIEVPLRIEADRLVVTVTSAKGDTYDFLVSTGNGATVVAESVLEGLGPEPELFMGSAPVDMGRPYPIDDAQLVYDGVALDGIVGSNTLNAYDVLLDAPAGRLLLRPVGAGVEWPGYALGEPIRLRVMHGVVIGLDVTADGRPYGAMLDTGAPVLVNAGAAEALGIETAGTVSLSLGDVDLGSVPVERSDISVFERWDPTGEGFVIVGGSLAFDCAMAISWVRREMRMCAR